MNRNNSAAAAGGALSLGIDIGTTTISAALLDAEHKRQLEAYTIENGTGLPTADKHFREQDPERILQKVQELLRSVCGAHPGIRTIGFTGQMHGILYVDKEGNAVSPLYTWQDARADMEVSGGKTYCDEIAERTGVPISSGYGLATHYYNAKNGLVPDTAETLCTIMDYAAMRVSGGRTPVMHATNAASLGLYDVAKVCFRRESLRALGLEELRLPRVTEKLEVIGYYEGIPVFTAYGDNQASFFGTVRSDGDILVNYGTGSQISAVTDRPDEVPGMEVRPYLEGKYLLSGSAICGGRAYAMLGRFFDAYLQSSGYPGGEQYTVMNQLAQSAYRKGDPLKVATTFCGTRRDPDRRGSITGIGEANFTPEQVVLGVLQGMVDELYDMYAESGDRSFGNLVASGNGVRKNPVLQQLLADRFGTPLRLPSIKEEAAFGAALAAAAAGELGSLAELKQCITYDETEVKPMAVSKFENTELAFSITRQGELLSAAAADKTVLECGFDGEQVTFSLLYDTNERMLSLTAKAALQDAVRIVLLPYRIELYVNGRLADEEWPWGKHFLAEAGFTADSVECAVTEYTEVKPQEPAILGTFQNAEGWQPEPDVFVGDCMPYYNDGRYHVLYLKDRHRHESKWHKGAHQWAHISTDDFVNWQIHPLAVEITEDWEGSICTGSWIKKGDREYLFYTIRTCDGSPAPLRRSVSADGYHFEKDPGFSFTISERYRSADARDPKVVLGEDGKYHMFLTTSLRESDLGCLVHLVSEDMDHWEEMPDPIYVASNGNQPECPDYFAFGGFYYLIFSHYGKGEYLYSEQPFSGWKKPEDNSIDCKSVPKMALWNGKIIFSGFDGGGKYAGTLTFMQAKQLPNGELTFCPLD